MNYKLYKKTKEIHCSKENWLKYQNRIVMNAIKEKTKINQNEILDYAYELINREEIQKFVDEENLNDDKKYYLFSPVVKDIKMTIEECEFEINLEYFLLDDLKIENLYNFKKIDFKPLILTDKKLEKSFEKFSKQFEVLQDADIVSESNIVRCEILPFLDDKPLDQYKDIITIKASSQKDGLINKDVMNHKLNDVFYHIEDVHQKVQIKIVSIQEIIYKELTNDNLKECGLGSFKNLDEVKTSFINDNLMINNHMETSKYFNKYIEIFNQENKIEFSEKLFENLKSRNFNKYINSLSEKEKADFRKETYEDKDKLYSWMKKLENDLRASIWRDIIIWVIKTTKNITEPSNEDKEEEWKFVHLMYDKYDIENRNINEERMNKGILDRKVSLLLMKSNNEIEYNELMENKNV